MGPTASIILFCVLVITFSFLLDKFLLYYSLNSFSMKRNTVNCFIFGTNAEEKVAGNLMEFETLNKQMCQRSMFIRMKCNLYSCWAIPMKCRPWVAFLTIVTLPFDLKIIRDHALIKTNQHVKFESFVINNSQENERKTCLFIFLKWPKIKTGLVLCESNQDVKNESSVLYNS